VRCGAIELSDTEALERCTRLVQYIFLTEHALPALRHFREVEENSQPRKEGINVQVPLADQQKSQPEGLQIE